MDDFMRWCQSLEPEWLGFVLWTSTLIIGLFGTIIVLIAILFILITFTGGFSTLAIIAAGALVACWIVALFGQPDD